MSFDITSRIRQYALPVASEQAYLEEHGQPAPEGPPVFIWDESDRRVKMWVISLGAFRPIPTRM